MKKIISIFVLSMAFVVISNAQTIKIVSGKADTVRTSALILKGITEKDSRIFVNGKEFPVYWTGVFAAQADLRQGANAVEIVAQLGAKKAVDTLNVVYLPREAEKEVQGIAIEKIELTPSEDMILSVGDELKIRVKATPASELTWLGDLPVRELPASESNGVAGYYQAIYKIKSNEDIFNNPLEIILKKDGQTVNKLIDAKIEVLDAENSAIMLRTVGDLPYLNYGLGTDRLGGSKISHITSGIVLKAVGKVGELYKVQLGKHYQAWIPESCTERVSSALFAPFSLVSSWSARGYDKTDVLSVSLDTKLPFRTFQEINPNRIIIDLFGAVTNTAWITQYPETLKSIANLTYEQIDDDILRIAIELKHEHWGYKIDYQGNTLIVTVKHRPRLSLNGLHIAIDAGHGGTNMGARGTTGIYEKVINLKFAELLKVELEKRGAQITMTRDADTDLSMSERILLLRKANPDLLVSIHCNAGGSPFTGKGSSTYYRHIGFRPLSTAILKRVLELGMNNFGNVGSFNFALSSPTEYPNVLVETLFLSSPEDEANLLDDAYKQRLMKKVAEGIEDYLKELK